MRAVGIAVAGHRAARRTVSIHRCGKLLRINGQFVLRGKLAKQRQLLRKTGITAPHQFCRGGKQARHRRHRPQRQCVKVKPAQPVANGLGVQFPLRGRRRGKSFLLLQNTVLRLLQVRYKVAAAELVLVDKLDVIRRFHVRVTGRVFGQNLFQFLQDEPSFLPQIFAGQFPCPANARRCYCSKYRYIFQLPPRCRFARRAVQ